MFQGRTLNSIFICRVIFSKVRVMLGGRVRLILSGGAPLSPDTHEMINICLCVNVIQGYGLTETTSCATIMDCEYLVLDYFLLFGMLFCGLILGYDRTVGRVGGPATACDIKLVNWEEGNYRITDKPYPRGEIVIGGDNISAGYYKLPDKTKEDFCEEDGKKWFKTGDIVEIQSDGVVKIIGNNLLGFDLR